MSDLQLNKLESSATGASDYVSIEQTESAADLLLMVDIESLALGTRPVITQVALLGYDLEQDELLENRFNQYLPIDPQLEIVPPRVISGGTIAYWMKQSDEARANFDLNVGTDFEDLVAAMRGLISTFNHLTVNGTRNYEISAKSPSFDLVAIETLLNELGLEVPWDFRRVSDLRTDLRRARIKHSAVPKPAGTIPHVAFWDARWQIDMWLECRKIRAGGRG